MHSKFIGVLPCDSSHECFWSVNLNDSGPPVWAVVRAVQVGQRAEDCLYLRVVEDISHFISLAARILCQKFIDFIVKLLFSKSQSHLKVLLVSHIIYVLGDCRDADLNIILPQRYLVSPSLTSQNLL